MNKAIVGLGLILVSLGITSLLYPIQEAYTETEEVHRWDLEARILAPAGQDQDSLFLARLMNSSRSFQLNLSSSDIVYLQVSRSRHNPEGKEPIFTQTGTSFNQEVETTTTATYIIDIENTNLTPVTLHGNIRTLQEMTKYRASFPYAFLGLLAILAGSIALYFGIFRRPKKPSRLKAKRKS